VKNGAFVQKNYKISTKEKFFLVWSQGQWKNNLAKKAIEVKRSRHFSSKDLKNLQVFKSDYPQAKCYFLYGGKEKFYNEGILIIQVGSI
jgi:hypothetical protein